MLSSFWWKLFLWIILAYPFIWLFKRFHSRGGGRWEVCGSAYPYKWVVKLDPTSPDFQGKLREGVSERLYDGSYVEHIGTREGQWFKAWESTIRENVFKRVQTDYVLTSPELHRSREIGRGLDGYN